MKISIQTLRKIIIITVFVLVAALLTWLIYFVFFRTPKVSEPTPTITPTSTPIGGLPGTEPRGEIPRVIPGKPGELPSAIAKGGLTQTNSVVGSPVSGIALSGNSLLYYDSIEGKFFSISPEGNVVSLSDKKFSQVQNVSWSPSSETAILEFPDGANIYYDFANERQVTLPKHWAEFGFSPSGDKIIFKSIAQEPENNFLAIADPNGGNAQIIASLGDYPDRVFPSWSPNRQIVATHYEPVDGERSELFFMGLNNENFKSVVVNGYGIETLWNPNGSQLLYSASATETNDSPALWIVNAEGEAIGSSRRPLNLATNADKCVFSDTTTLYCAVPQFLPQGSGIMPSIADGIPDDIYKIDVTTGATSLLANLDIPLSINSLMLSPDKRFIYFTDDATNRLRSIRLE